MSDAESASAAPHPPVGGKSLKALERPPYKSWRKKYRKMRWRFDAAFELNKRLFKEEQKLECVAKRLKEDLDGLLELCLEINQNPAMPPEFRYDISHNHLPVHASQAVPENVTPEEANDIFMRYNSAVRGGQLPHIDLHVIREVIDARLAAQEVETLPNLETRVPHAVPSAASSSLNDPTPINYLTPDQENDYILRLDAKLGDPYSLTRTSSVSGPAAAAGTNEPDDKDKEKHWAELTPRELERQTELLNPQSQHNWLKAKARSNPSGAPLGFTEGPDDNESLASHDNGAPGGPKAGGGGNRRRPNSTKNNLAKQVGDRALERAREGWSPGAGSAMDEDEVGGEEGAGAGGGAKKKGRDPDGTYRLKGSKGGSAKGKRKRSGEDVVDAAVGVGGSAVKKVKMEGEGE